MNQSKIKKDTSGEVSTAIVEKKNDIVNFNIETLMGKAIENGLSPETMEKFLAMRQQLKAEWAKEQYNKAMANFQASCPTIVKTKEVKTKSGVVAYRYAPIESIVSQIATHLQANGFSYSTNMELMENGVKVSVKTTHIDGHSEVTEMHVPLGNKTDIMSQSQVVAAAQTFAKRYAFCNAFGILTGDEDNDGADVAVQPKRVNYAPGINRMSETDKLFTPFVKRLEECDTIEALYLVGKEMVIARKNGKLDEKNYTMLVNVGKQIKEKKFSNAEAMKIADELEF
jgi:hypothetical protein